MFCPDCGTELEPRNKILKFCCNCGFDVRNRNKELINKDLEIKKVFVINKKNKNVVNVVI